MVAFDECRFFSHRKFVLLPVLFDSGFPKGVLTLSPNDRKRDAFLMRNLDYLAKIALFVP